MIQRALGVARFFSFGEGHLWLELIECFARFRDPEYRKGTKRKYWTLGEGRNILLEKYVALAIDRFHRDNVPWKPVRWLDKSPGSAAVKLAPLLAEVFPKSQFIFMYRNGITAVNSGIKLQPDNPNAFRWMCCGWAETMSTWRKVRGLLEGRYIEIAQEEMASHPEETAVRLTDFLHIPEHREAIAELFRTCRTNTAFPGKPPGDYSYEIDWSEEQKEYFIQTCGEEMRAWGYAIDFIHPVGLSPARSTEHQVTIHEPAPTWSNRFRTAWSVLQAEGPLALLSKTKRFLYYRFISRWKGRSRQ